MKKRVRERDKEEREKGESKARWSPISRTKKETKISRIKNRGGKVVEDENVKGVAISYDSRESFSLFSRTSLLSPTWLRITLLCVVSS